MTDRYYPKNFVPDSIPLSTTYNEMNEMTTLPRSKFPPGYSGHEHGSGEKFGYSIPAPNPLMSQPINPEDELVNYRVGKHIQYRPIENRVLELEQAKDEKKESIYPRATYLGVEEQKASLKIDDHYSASFVPQTSSYLASMNGNRGVTLEKAQPYIPACEGRGTGFNSQSTYISWLPPSEKVGTTVTQDSFPPPKVVRKGLEFTQYTMNN